MNFNLKKPCANCPFNKVGAIKLNPGRVEGIIETLCANDREWFMCHKTVHSKHGGDWDGEDGYQPSGNESQCMGSIIYLQKIGRPSLSMRMAYAFNMLDLQAVEQQYDTVIDPPEGSNV